MKYDAHVFLPESEKGTSELTQNAQFILRASAKKNGPRQFIAPKK